MIMGIKPLCLEGYDGQEYEGRPCRDRDVGGNSKPKRDAKWQLEGSARGANMKSHRRASDQIRGDSQKETQNKASGQWKILKEDITREKGNRIDSSQRRERLNRQLVRFWTK